VREKHLERWLFGYLRHVVTRRLHRANSHPRHLIFALCDHYEPLWGRADELTGRRRVAFWLERYPQLATEFRDSEGRPPRHSFFFPGEQYRPELLSGLASLARGGLGEVELHLHHDGDTESTLRESIAGYLASYTQHGHLARDADGRARYAFIHGNWCLANSREDQRWCGVDAEIPLLFDTGCYADFTFPSAPDSSQPHIVNQIYWPDGNLRRARAYERGTPARVGEVRTDRILMIEGPLAVARGRKMRIRLENGALTARDPATQARAASWVAQNVHVCGRPSWTFVKVHTHGAPEPQAASLLGAGGRALHQALRRYNDGERWRLHYVTAREMFNIAVACMNGRGGDPADYRDYALKPPPVCS
jgi:hypothetical protein